MVGIYNKLYDMYSAHQLFYIIGIFYAVLFCIMGLLLLHEMEDTTPDPSRPLGWISYCAIESFGSIGVAQFWAFTNTVYDKEGAEKSYGLIIAGAQVQLLISGTCASASTGVYSKSFTIISTT